MKINELVDLYLQSVKQLGSYDSKESATKIISKAISSGWSPKQILHAIKNKHPRASFLNDILYSKENLIREDKNLYHSQLRILPPLPKSQINEETGEISCINLEEPFLLEYVKVFTTYNLVNYYYSLFGLKPNSQEVKRDIGIFKYYLNTYNIDQLLFIIDAAFDYANDRGSSLPRNAFVLQDYTREGIEVYEHKIAFDRAVGSVADTDQT